MDLAAVNHSGHAHASQMTYSATTLPGKKVVEGTFDPEKKNNAPPPELFLSDAGKRLLGQDDSTKTEAGQKGSDDKVTEEDKPKVTDPNQATSPSGQTLSESELQEIEELKRRDAEVKAHEQAHLAAAGNLAKGAVNFDYETGPDGNRYAVGGDVSIDTSEVPGDPQATLLKAQRIRRAANAPADPSPQDRSVAAEASRMEVNARAEISEEARARQQEFIDENAPEIDFFSARINQTEKDIQDTYKRIQNAGVLEEPKTFVDFFI